MQIALGYIKQIGVSIINHPDQLFILPRGIFSFIYIIPLLVSDWYFRGDERVLKFSNKKLINMLVYTLILLTILYSIIDNDHSTFIYFQF
jgi:hypothetical protein